MSQIKISKITATLSYIGSILFLNLLLVRLPLVSSFGEQFSPADMLVGIIYLVRDFAQREIKHYVILAMLIGALLSYLFATPDIAIASLSSFIAGELLDWALFSFTKKPLSQRLLLSSLISSPIDSLLFLWLADRLHWVPFTIMSTGKIIGIFALWLTWIARQNRKNWAILTK